VAALATMLARETLAAEQELRQRADLHVHLGLPKALRKCLNAPPSRSGTPAVRVMRFDFHWTLDGWRISEANTDVAGGFIEHLESLDYLPRNIPNMSRPAIRRKCWPRQHGT